MEVGRFGLDPEVAILSKKTGKGRSAHLFPYIQKKKVFEFYADTMENKKKGSGYPGSEVERDGAALEVRSIAETACRDNFIPYLAEALRQTHLNLTEWNSALKLSSTPKFELDATSFKGKVPDDVTEFGCRPDTDAYTMKQKDPVCDASDKRRWTGGHIHASNYQMRKWGTSLEKQAAMTILFDYCVALPMVGILGEPYADGEAERRIMYGQPGSFRFDVTQGKIEFRTLSGRLLLSPILLYWATGMVKAMFGATSDDPRELLAKIAAEIDADDVRKIILNHDVAGAEFLAPRIFEFLPNYNVNKYDLANPVSGGGSGTSNPYFFHQAFNVLVEANREGLFWPDDMQRNWGLYEDYVPTHHAYWGVQQAFAGLTDESIFPQRPLLQKLWPNEFIQENPIYTHPLNGGAKQWTTSGAKWWLT